MPRKLPPAVAYTMSVAFEKGLSIITIPLMALFLEPGDYGRYDVALSLVEFITLVLGLGLSHTLIRFVSTAQTEEEKAYSAAELLGSGLMLAIVLGILVQIVLPTLVDFLSIKVELTPLRMLIAAAAVGSLIEMPLVWLRLKGQAQLFMYYTMGRAALQALTTWTVLALGYGVSGVMIGNSTILLSFAVLLVIRQWRVTGAVITRRSLQRIREYGVPLIGAGLALFAVGNANRLFLPGHVTDAEIAYFGVASRLAIATALLYYPFELWWNPQRIGVLNEPGGLKRSAITWGLGYSILLLSGLAIALAGPTFIVMALPKSYEPAALLLPFLVVIQVLHLTGSLSNVGCYAKENSLEVLAIDIISAIVALTGYYTLIPMIGIWGAVLSMTLAYLARLCLYLVVGWRKAPIRYPIFTALFVSSIAALFFYLAPHMSSFFLRAGWSMVSFSLIGLILYKMGMLQLPKQIQEQLLSMVRNVRNI